MVCIAYCLLFGCKLYRLINSVGEERARFSAIDYSFFSKELLFLHVLGEKLRYFIAALNLSLNFITATDLRKYRMFL